MTTKNQSLPWFIAFHKMIEKQLNLPIKCLQSDNGGEFLAFRSYLAHHDIFHHFLCLHTPQQNGRAKRKIRHVVDTAIALMTQASVPSKYWRFAFNTASYLINFLPTKTLHNTTPFHLPYATPPSYSHLRIFGCLCFHSSPSLHGQQASS